LYIPVREPTMAITAVTTTIIPTLITIPLLTKSLIVN